MSNPGNLCPAVTSINCTMERGRFPGDEDPCYLAQKAEIALRLPSRIVIKGGSERFLKQLVMSSLIQIEEKIANYHWPYKAEVVFAMAKPVPLPMLATSETSKKKYGEDLPQSSNPFAQPSSEDWIKRKVKRMRRPDIILVKDRTKRWPGREATYFDGKFHDDNLKMLIEVKFPGDTLSDGQRIDYALIATDTRFGVMRIVDNRTDRQKVYDREYSLIPRPTAERYILPALHPLTIPELPLEGAPGSIPQPLYKYLPLLSTIPWDFMPSFEDWVRFGDNVSSLAEEGWEYVSESTRKIFNQYGASAYEQQKWFCQQVLDPVTQQTKYVFSWMNKKTYDIIIWSEETVRSLWRTVLSGMDITLDYLEQIDWVQVLSNIGDGMVQLAILVKKVMTVVILTIVVVVALVALVAIVAAAAEVGAVATLALFAMLATVGGGPLLVAQ